MNNIQYSNNLQKTSLMKNIIITSIIEEIICNSKNRNIIFKSRKYNRMKIQTEQKRSAHWQIRTYDPDSTARFSSLRLCQTRYRATFQPAKNIYYKNINFAYWKLISVFLRFESFQRHHQKLLHNRLHLFPKNQLSIHSKNYHALFKNFVWQSKKQPVPI